MYAVILRYPHLKSKINPSLIIVVHSCCRFHVVVVSLNPIIKEKLQCFQLIGCNSQDISRRSLFKLVAAVRTQWDPLVVSDLYRIQTRARRLRIGILSLIGESDHEKNV